VRQNSLNVLAFHGFGICSVDRNYRYRKARSWITPGHTSYSFCAQWFDIVVNVDHSNFFLSLNKIESYNPTLSNIKLQYDAYFPGLRHALHEKVAGLS
jgi:hypothetical protein